MPADDQHILIGGAYAKSPWGDLPVYGWEIKINPLEHDIEEAALITNLNFHVYVSPAVLDPNQLKGPKYPGPTQIMV
jgi:hypothetical protein